MIDRASIMAWNEFVPWTDFAMVEQDLIISRALVDIFSDEFLREQCYSGWSLKYLRCNLYA
jgi:hypothetical protein